MYSGFERTFDSAGSWSFDNETSRNDTIFGVDSRSLSHADKPKK